MADLNVALVHDYLREYGGAERVLEALHELYPDAPVYVGFVDWQALGLHADRFRSWNIRQTWIATLPLHKKLFSPYRIFAPKAFASLDLKEFDVVISSSNAYFAKAVRVPNGRHLCYCHTPPRALYGYATMSDWKANPIIRLFGQLLNHVLRVEDYYMAQAVDQFIANSAETARRIAKFYRKTSVVIAPPVAIADGVAKAAVSASGRASVPLPALKDRRYLLYVNRLALAKHPELAVAAAQQLGMPLTVVGEGKMRAGLEKDAGPMITFTGAVTDEQLHQLYSGARLLLYPVEDEDFGIVPIEAMAHGVPVVAHRSGGPMETVIDGKTGVLFDTLTADGLTAAARKVMKLELHEADFRNQVTRFTTENFKKRIERLVTEQAGV